MNREDEDKSMTSKEMPAQRDSLSLIEKGQTADLARRKILAGAVWMAPLVLTVVSVKAYGAQATCLGPPPICPPGE